MTILNYRNMLLPQTRLLPLVPISHRRRKSNINNLHWRTQKLFVPKQVCIISGVCIHVSRVFARKTKTNKREWKYPSLLYGQLRERTKWTESYDVIGYPSRQDSAISPARDYPLSPAKNSVFFFFHKINPLLTKLVRSNNSSGQYRRPSR